MSRKTDLFILLGLLLIAAAAAGGVFAYEVLRAGQSPAALLGLEPTASPTPTTTKTPTPLPTPTETATPSPTPTARVEIVTVVVTVPTPTPLPPSPTPAPSLQELGLQAARSLVKLAVPTDLEMDSAGSGSIIDGEKGLILTNWHVVGDDEGNLLTEDGVAGILWSEDPDQPAVLAFMGQVLPDYSDPELDLALILITHRVENQESRAVEWPLDLPAVPFGDSDRVRLGDPVVVLGYPDYADGNASWTEGTVTVHDEEWIKSDALVSHGHSGGMVLDRQGYLIAILTQIQWIGWDGELAVARPINATKALIQEAMTQVQPPTAAPSPQLFRLPQGDLLTVFGTEELALHQKPGLQQPVVGRLAQGDSVEVLADPQRQGERLWFHVQALSTGWTGWASDEYLVSAETASTPILFSSDQTGSHNLYSVRADGSQLAQITDLAGDEDSPSRSPDGDYVVFAHTLRGDADLFAMNAQGSHPLRLTRHRTDEVQPAWSPDGRRIAYASNRDGDMEIYLLDLVSEEAEALTANRTWDGFPSWSPDSRNIAFASLRTGNEDLFVLNLASGSETQLTTNPLLDTHPAWSPQGDQIAYTRTVTDGMREISEIAILDLGTPASPRPLASPPEGMHYRSPDWSPDGRWLVFVADGPNGAAIYRIPARGGEPAKIADAPGLGNSAPAWLR
jgi:Tol biopolymer transport system component/S1-C subfamily serine protease